jgi:hypothetical protein
MKKSESKQLVSSEDRDTLRTWLSNRLKQIKKEQKKAGEAAEAAFSEGAEMEIIFAFDDLLGEQVPDTAKKARPQ